jgi:hypothetical protein
MAFTTPGTAVAGDVLTAAFWNSNVRDNLNFLYSPPSCRVVRTSDLTSYSSGADITWSSESWDTDTMFSTGTTITINTAGLYLLSFVGRANGTSVSRILPTIKVGGTSCVTLESALSTGDTLFSISSIETLTVGAQITAAVSFVAGSAYVVQGNAALAQNQTRLTTQWVGTA